MDCPSPGFLWLLEDGDAAEVLDAPSAVWCRVFCHLAVTFVSPSLPTRSQSQLYRDALLLNLKMQLVPIKVVA